MTITLCVIMKDEEEVIERCLSSVKDFVDEIVVVDTGSSDLSIQKASKYTKDIFRFKWTNSFSDAKNFAISKVSSDWILFLDADEYLKMGNVENFYKLLEYEYEEPQDGILVKLTNIHSDGSFISDLYTTRLFKNHKDIRYRYSIHEELCKDKNPIVSKQVEHIESVLELYHTGYSSEKSIKKAKRNLKLLETDDLNPKLKNLYLSDAYLMLKDFEQSAFFAQEQLKLDVKLVGGNMLVYNNLMKSFFALNKFEEIDLYLSCLQSEYSNHPMTDYYSGTLFMGKNNIVDAIKSFESSLVKNVNYKDVATNYFPQYELQVHNNLALLYLEIGDFTKSIAHLSFYMETDIYDFDQMKLFLEFYKILPQNYHSKLINLYLLKGVTLFQSDNYDDALELFLELYQLVPKNEDVRYNLKFILDFFGEHELSKQI